jgi:hypothetical protein
MAGQWKVKAASVAPADHEESPAQLRYTVIGSIEHRDRRFVARAVGRVDPHELGPYKLESLVLAAEAEPFDIF